MQAFSSLLRGLQWFLWQTAVIRAGNLSRGPIEGPELTFTSKIPRREKDPVVTPEEMKITYSEIRLLHHVLQEVPTKYRICLVFYNWVLVLIIYV